ncbi:HDOD domain-containing protein [Pseudoduganella violaceinigra]|uniref:HDOD domain-containing protein n=1 Tax=Pseudoduganella violaceinigra TaxID=246602 RepID=UPI0004068642|nr:HDOD domain-containing protein [Pseudoduganella violaceinigra]
MYQWLKRLLAKPDNGPQAAAATAAPAPQRPSPPPAPAPVRSPALEGGPDFEQKDLVNSAFQRWLFALPEREFLDATAPEGRVLHELILAAQSGHNAADMLRRMPGVIPQLLQSLRSENFAGADIARKISNDLVLVGSVLRLANAAIQNSGEPTTIHSVEHAVIVVGQEGLRHLVTSVAFRPIIDLNSGHYTKLLAPRIWTQSEKSAVACRMLAPEFGVDPFEAFLAGLVFNSGLLTALRVMDSVNAGPGDLGSATFRARLASEAIGISAGISEAWSFPPAVTVAIREQASTRKGGIASPMGRVLAVGDYLAKVRMLQSNNALNDTEHNLFHDLPIGAMPCYAAI